MPGIAFGMTLVWVVAWAQVLEITKLGTGIAVPMAVLCVYSLNYCLLLTRFTGRAQPYVTR